MFLVVNYIVFSHPGTILTYLVFQPLTPVGDVPLHLDVREGADRGCPVLATQPHSPLSSAYLAIASRLLEKLSHHQSPHDEHS